MEGGRVEGEGCRQETGSGGRGYIPELCCASAGVRQSSSWAKISSVFRSERCPCSPPSPAFPAFLLCCLSSSGLSNAHQLSWDVGSAPGARATGRTQTEQLVSFYPQRPPSHVSFPLTGPYQKRSGAQPKKSEKRSYSTHCTLIMNQFLPLRNLFHRGET